MQDRVKNHVNKLCRAGFLKHDHSADDATIWSAESAGFFSHVRAPPGRFSTKIQRNYSVLISSRTELVNIIF